MPRRSSRRYRRRHAPQHSSAGDQRGLGRLRQRSRLVRWCLAACVAALALVLIDTSTGMLRRGRSPEAALLLDGLLLVGGVILYVLVLR